MKYFSILSGEIEGRLDPSYYTLQFKNMGRTLYPLKLIKEVCTIRDGDHNILPIEYISTEKEGVRYLRAQDLKAGEIISENSVYVSKEYFSSIPRSHIKPSYFLFSIMATIGSIAVAPDWLGECTANRAVGILIPKDKNQISPYYLEALFSTSFGTNLLNRIKKGGIQQRTNLGDVGEIAIPLPPKEVQIKAIQLIQQSKHERKEKEREIKELLSSTDSYLLKELGIILQPIKERKIFIVSSNDLCEHRIDVSYYLPSFKEIEKAINNGKFKAKELRDFIKMNNKLENIQDYNAINYVDLSSINKTLGIIQESSPLSPEEAPSRARQKLEKGDLLLSGLSGSLKSIAVFDKSESNFIASTGFHIIKKSEDYNNYYLFALFRSLLYQSLLNRETTGAIMSSINREALLNVKIPLPPISIQNKIAEEVKKRMQKAELLQEEAKEELEKAKRDIEKIILGK